MKIQALATTALATAVAAGIAAAATTADVPLAELMRSPSTTIGNGLLEVQVFLPDAEKGFYRGPRFDWAGMIGSLRYRGHDFYVPWFTVMSPGVRDYEYRDGQVIASPWTAANGPVEEFNAEGGALGYAEAAPGGRFIKIGVGVLQRNDDSAYSPFRAYPLLDAGQRKVRIRRDRIEFRHDLADRASGYGYRYTKVLRLPAGEPVMLVEHELRNTGSKPITTKVYDHNFLDIDGRGTVAGLRLETRFAMTADREIDPQLAMISGQRLDFLAKPAIGRRVLTMLAGHGNSPADFDFTVTDPESGASVRMTADQPVDHVQLWAIPPVMAIEPYVSMSIAPGKSFRWTYRYAYGAPPDKPAPVVR